MTWAAHLWSLGPHLSIGINLFRGGRHTRLMCSRLYPLQLASRQQKSALLNVATAAYGDCCWVCSNTYTHTYTWTGDLLSKHACCIINQQNVFNASPNRNHLLATTRLPQALDFNSCHIVVAIFLLLLMPQTGLVSMCHFLFPYLLRHVVVVVKRVCCPIFGTRLLLRATLYIVLLLKISV